MRFTDQEAPWSGDVPVKLLHSTDAFHLSSIVRLLSSCVMLTPFPARRPQLLNSLPCSRSPIHPQRIHASLAEPDAAPIGIGALPLDIYEVLVNLANIGKAPVALSPVFFMNTGSDTLSSRAALISKSFTPTRNRHPLSCSTGNGSNGDVSFCAEFSGG